MPEGIVVEQREDVQVLHMRFGRANALSPDNVEALIGALGGLDGPTVITGEDKIFCAGLDLLEVDKLDRDAMATFVERFSVLLTQTLTTRAPLVAAVNGHAVAGGCVLAMAADHRVGVEGRYKIGMNEIAIGLTLPAIVMEIMRGKLTAAAARNVVLGADLVDPEAAVRVGLLDGLAANADAAINEACDKARRLARSPAEFAAMKGALVAPITERFATTREAIDRRFLDSWFTESACQKRREAVERLAAR